MSKHTIMLVASHVFIVKSFQNRVVFDGASFTLSRWLVDFKNELCLVCIRAKQSVKQSLQLWLENIPFNAFLLLLFGLCKPCKWYSCIYIKKILVGASPVVPSKIVKNKIKEITQSSLVID